MDFSKRKSAKDSLIVLTAIFVGVMALLGVLGAVCWPYTINYWLVFLDKEPTMLWWHGVLMGYIPIMGQLVWPLAVLTWVLSLFI